ncbi:DUF1573 domain-containing protein [Flavihumibacter fluvii]|uniref:DUF1573 domain-containing protein n=1 Tax=Flavihumibacter fluvii TaxID=2838157 RepID=UPI001BDDDD2E|nr:DUF1573 domain-containing protein [Flavihumibacter fluvii]ULQ53069.1 DUF1573 domain-containing protein [Flavihumibacter fluvii]
MKKFTIFLAMVFCATIVTAQNAPTAVPADPLAIAALHDFGTIPQGRPVTFDFQLTNTGKDLLKIENVSASCGCTTPKWSPDPVQPGQKSTITVGYNAAGEGIFEKSVTITYNGSQTKTIYIKGQVAKAIPSAPANTSVALLKQVN